MGRTVGIHDVAELAVPAGAASAALPVTGAAELAVPAGVAMAAVGVTGPAESAVLAGPQLVPAPAFDTPTLDAWNYVAAYSGSLIYLTFYSNVTGGEPCEILFLLQDTGGERLSISTVRTTPEQNSPHTQAVQPNLFAYGGRWYQLSWRWRSGVEIGFFEDVPGGLVYLPAFGDAPSIGGGP